MKTQTVNCGECGRPYEKPCYDLDLNFGDQVVHADAPALEKFPITIMDTTHKEMGLYFGNQSDVVYPSQILDHVRVDTRNYKFVKVEPGKPVDYWQPFSDRHPKLGQLIKVRDDLGKVTDFGTVKVLADLGHGVISISSDRYVSAVVRPHYEWCEVRT